MATEKTNVKVFLSRVVKDGKNGISKKHSFLLREVQADGSLTDLKKLKEFKTTTRATSEAVEKYCKEKIAELNQTSESYTYQAVNF